LTPAAARRAPRATDSPAESIRPVLVGDLLSKELADLGLGLAAGRAGLQNEITQARVQRPGLALAGYSDYLTYGRVQIIGASEISYLATLSPRRRVAAVERVTSKRISCLVGTKGLELPDELLRSAEMRRIPVLRTPLASTPFIGRLSALLQERLAPHTHIHADLVDVFGLGVLITGESGIGKSECALDLVDRGHRLVADDVVEIRRLADTLVGSCPELTRDHMEIRGLGIVNVEDLYGVSSVRAAKKLEVVVALERWEPGREYDRLGLLDERFSLLLVDIPLLRLPVAPGRNLALLVEVASRTQLQKERGYDAARGFVSRVDALVKERRRRGARP
jgi:HPr kinase/phosphorylase